MLHLCRANKAAINLSSKSIELIKPREEEELNCSVETIWIKHNANNEEERSATYLIQLSLDQSCHSLLGI